MSAADIFEYEGYLYRYTPEDPTALDDLAYLERKRSTRTMDEEIPDEWEKMPDDWSPPQAVLNHFFPI